MKQKILTTSILLAISQGALAAVYNQGDDFFGPHPFVEIDGGNVQNLDPSTFSNGTIGTLVGTNKSLIATVDMVVDSAVINNSELSTSAGHITDLNAAQSTIYNSGTTFGDITLNNSNFTNLSTSTSNSLTINNGVSFEGAPFTTSRVTGNSISGSLSGINIDSNSFDDSSLLLNGPLSIDQSNFRNVLNVHGHGVGIDELILNNTLANALYVNNASVYLGVDTTVQQLAINNSSAIRMAQNATAFSMLSEAPTHLVMEDSANIGFVNLISGGDTIYMSGTSSMNGGYIHNASFTGMGGILNDISFDGGTATFVPGTFNLNNVRFQNTNITSDSNLQITDVAINDGIHTINTIGGDRLDVGQNARMTLGSTNLNYFNVDGSSVDLTSNGFLRNINMSNHANVQGHYNLFNTTNMSLDNSSAFDFNFVNLEQLNAVNSSSINFSGSVMNASVDNSNILGVNASAQNVTATNSSVAFLSSNVGSLNLTNALLHLGFTNVNSMSGTIADAHIVGSSVIQNAMLSGGYLNIRENAHVVNLNTLNSRTTLSNDAMVGQYVVQGGSVAMYDNAHIGTLDVDNTTVTINGGSYDTFNAVDSTVVANVTMNQGSANLTNGSLTLNNNSRLANLTTNNTDVIYAGQNTATVDTVNATGGSLSFGDEMIGQSFNFNNVNTNGTLLSARVDVDNNISDQYVIAGQYAGSGIFDVALSGTPVGGENIQLMSFTTDTNRSDESMTLQGTGFTNLSGLQGFSLMSGAYALANSPYIWNLNGLSNGWFLQSSSAFTPSTTSHVTLPLVTAYQTMPSVMDHVSNRLRKTSDVGVWGQYVQDQSTLESFAGIQSNTRLKGFDIGRDVMIGETRVGFGLSYRDQDTKHNQATNNGYVASTDASGKTWAAQLYADKNMGDVHVSSQFAFAHNKHDNTYNTGIVHSTGDAYSMQFSADKSFETHGLTVKPSLGLRYVKANESVNFEDTSILAVVDVSKVFSNDVTLTLSPTLSHSIARDKTMNIDGIGEHNMNVDRTRFGFNIQLDKTIGNKQFYLKAGSKSLGQGNQWDVSFGGSLKF